MRGGTTTALLWRSSGFAPSYDEANSSRNHPNEQHDLVERHRGRARLRHRAGLGAMTLVRISAAAERTANAAPPQLRATISHLGMTSSIEYR